MCAIAITNNTYSSVNLLQLNINHINLENCMFLYFSELILRKKIEMLLLSVC